MGLPTLRIGTTVDHYVGTVTARQSGNDDGFIDDNGNVPFWWTKTGIIVKWSLFLGILALFTAYLVIGYMHAKKRMARGLPPLGYHRWLVPRSQLARVDPRYAYPVPAGYSTYRPPQNEYGMYAMPPPVYNPNEPRPPVYGADMYAGGPKVEPEQSRSTRQPAVAEEYPAPAGPPPSAMRP